MCGSREILPETESEKRAREMKESWEEFFSQVEIALKPFLESVNAFLKDVSERLKQKK